MSAERSRRTGETEVSAKDVPEKVLRAFANFPDEEDGFVIELDDDGSYFNLYFSSLSPEDRLIERGYWSAIREVITLKTTFLRKRCLKSGGWGRYRGWEMRRRVHIIDEEIVVRLIENGTISRNEFLMDSSWELSYQQITWINKGLDERGWSELVVELRNI